MPLAKPLGLVPSRPLTSYISCKIAYYCRRRWYSLLCKLVDVLYKVLLLLYG